MLYFSLINSFQALARALYSGQPVMILDDVLTGLDRTTENSILQSVFAEEGLLKSAQKTVVLATNTGMRFMHNHI